MSDSKPSFRPVEYRDGYLPIRDHGLIGDGQTCALVGRDGAVDWLCVPRIDSPPLFCGMLDAHMGGAFRIAPVGAFESCQSYDGDTAVLVTEMRTDTGLLRIRDALTLRGGADLTEDAPAAREELVREVRVVEGHVDMQVSIEAYGGAAFDPTGEALRLILHRNPQQLLYYYSSLPIDESKKRIRLSAGGPEYFVLSWSASPGRHRPVKAAHALESTHRAWRAWMRDFQYEGPHEPKVRRSTITLKLLDNFTTGAIVAAPTTSLPEKIGGLRNWDYRYSWIRDASFAVYALSRVGFKYEAGGYLAWVLDAFERSGKPKVLYRVDGSEPKGEQEDKELEGYRKSRPVRWGNAAASQIQNDLYGEVLDCAHIWAKAHGEIDQPLWEKLCALVEDARREWHIPDRGIWEVRSEGRPFTYSAALCQVAIERAVRISRTFGLQADVEVWERDAEAIKNTILTKAWSDKLQSFTQHIGGGGLDASLLSLPIRRVISATDPRMVSTTNAIAKHLSGGHGLIYRYDPKQSPDGVPGSENPFLLCSFWLVDNLAEQGRIQEAMDLYDSLCGRADPLGLLPEEVDAETGEFRGNYPQALTHVGLISSGVRLAKTLAAQQQQPSGTAREQR